MTIPYLPPDIVDKWSYLKALACVSQINRLELQKNHFLHCLVTLDNWGI